MSKTLMRFTSTKETTMRFARPRPCTVNTLGVDVSATMQLGYPTHPSDGDTEGALLLHIDVDTMRAVNDEMSEVDVMIPIEVVREMLAAHEREE